MTTILALGPRGTNGHEAASRIATRMGEGVHVELESHAEVFGKVCAGRCLAMVPIENSLTGPVADTIRDFWMKQSMPPKIRVVGEVTLPIQHCLLVLKPRSDGYFPHIFSHPQALLQCREHLSRFSVGEILPTRSTGEAAMMISTQFNYETSAAIASPFATKVYGLQIANDHMEDVSNNTTRFHILGRKTPEPTDADRTALLFWIRNEPRSLHGVTTVFAEQEVNMSSIHSLPLGLRSSCAFYVEFEEHIRTNRGKQLVRALSGVTTRMLILGSYPQDTVS